MRCFILFALLLMSASLMGCGFLDTDMSMSDEEFEGSMGVGGIGMSGIGISGGCGGVGYARRGTSRFRHGTARAGMQEINLGDFHIYGRRGPGSKTAATETDSSVSVPQPEPVDWVGHFDAVSADRQNVLLAAWVEGQLEARTDSESAEPRDLVHSGSEIEVGQR